MTIYKQITEFDKNIITNIKKSFDDGLSPSIMIESLERHINFLKSLDGDKINFEENENNYIDPSWYFNNKGIKR